jgi:large subunit ribosomal protein L17
MVKRIGTPTKGRRMGGSGTHEKLMLANLTASLIAAEAIVTNRGKAKLLRPVAEKVITKAKKGGTHNHRQVVAYLGEQGHGPQAVRGDRAALRHPQRCYTRILKLGPPQRDTRADGQDRAGLVICASDDPLACSRRPAEPDRLPRPSSGRR